MIFIPPELNKRLGERIRHLPTRSFAKGSIILHLGDIPKCGYFIREGVIKNSTIDSTGVERPVVFDMQGEVFPIGYLMGFYEEAVYYYAAFTDVTVTELSREALDEILKSDGEVAYEFSSVLARRLIATQMRVEGLEQSRAADKLVYTLRFMCTRFGTPLDTTHIRLGLNITQQELANFVGLTRETTAIEMKKLQSQGAIDYDRAQITVDIEKIKDIIDSLR